MKRLKQMIKNTTLFLPMTSVFCLSALLSGVAIADNNNEAFPPTATHQKNVTASTPTPVKPVPQYYVPLMQGYRTAPYRYYYPQQHMPAIAPNQWGYPQQRYLPAYPNYQPYTQYQVVPNYRYPVAPSVAGMQIPYSNYSQPTPTYNNPMANPPTNKPVYPMRKKIKKEKQAWGDERHIWPDFYTGSTGDLWDKMINAPFDAGRIPGGWRAPSLSTPDPATVSDAIANQMPPIAEEMGNMTNFAN